MEGAVVKRIAVIGLVCCAGAAAHAQPAAKAATAPTGPNVSAARAGVAGPAQGPALPGPSAAPAPEGCQLVSKAGEQYVESPLVGFEPGITSKPLPVVQANSGAAMVLCNRSTIVPELTDYRVLTEMRLPLAIKSGAKTLFLVVKDGQLQFALPDGDATPDEMKALSARQTEMRTAMAGKTAAK
jgi:hypothetical protein